MNTTKWIARDMLTTLENTLTFAKSLPRALRVRRRGFSSRVRQGDQVRHADAIWTVARRSNWHLWLYEYVAMTGSSVTVKLPKRFAGKKEKAIA